MEKTEIDEIEVTREMIDAGERAYHAERHWPGDPPICAADLIRIFREMARVRRQ